MDKQAIRERVWDDLEESGAARFPFPPHGRIPNFASADEAAERLTGLDAWKQADSVKVNPDAPQLPVRRRALREGKTVYMAVPRLRDEKCFLELDPQRIDDIEAAPTVSSMDEYGRQVGPEEMDSVDLIVSGSVAVDGSGARIGKGEGYSDLEFAVLREAGLVGDGTVTVTTVHERQVVDESIESTPRDVPMDVLVTPDRTVETAASDSKPTGIDWDELSEERIEEIPILDQMADR